MYPPGYTEDHGDDTVQEQQRIYINEYIGINMNNSSNSINATLTNTTDDDTGLRGYQYSLFVTNIAICSLNLIGNLGILVLICQRRLLGRTTNVFVFSLSMADTICCSGAIPYNILMVLNMNMSVYLCKGYFYALCISRTAVSYTVVLLTTEKILNILHPARFITAGRCMFFISLVWFFSAAYNVWAVVFYTIYDYDKIAYMDFMMDSSSILFGKRCFFSHRFEALREIFLTLDFVILFILPCAVLAIEFCAILRKQHGTIKQRFETYYYIMRFIFFIFVVYITCHLPFEVGTLVKGGKRDPREIVDMLYEIATTLYYTRGLMYLVVYIYFKQYLCKRSRRLNAATSSSQQRNRMYLELPIRGQCRGLSLNELRLVK